MAKPDDEDLILHLYREHPDAERIERALEGDPALRRRLDRLASDLEALAALEPPEPRTGLEGRIWHRVAPELERVPRQEKLSGPLWTARRLLLAAAAALVLVAAGFLAGRLGRPGAVASGGETVAASPLTADARERVLAAALVDHLDASERLLVELANDRAPSLAEERRFAEALLASNRLYRRAAERAGHRRAAALLAELEPLLVELANAPDGGGDELAAARDRLESNDLLFKVRVTRSNI